MADTLSGLLAEELRVELELRPPRRRRERDTSWHKGALCSDLGATAFYAADPQPAKALCRACPARIPCAVHGLEFGERYGIWGGLDPTELEELRAELTGSPARQRPKKREVPMEDEVSMSVSVSDYVRATAAMVRAKEELAAAQAARREAVRRLYGLGLSAGKISARLGLSRSRVGQLLEVKAAG